MLPGSHARQLVIPLLVALLACAALVQPPVRQATLSALRFPFTLTKALVKVLSSLAALPSLTEENAQLRAEIMKGQRETARLREALREAGSGAALRGRWNAEEGPIASVVQRSLQPTQQTVLLDRGSRGGVVLDSVIVDAGGVIGRVVEVQAWRALVVLLTN